MMEVINRRDTNMPRIHLLYIGSNKALLTKLCNEKIHGPPGDVWGLKLS